MTITYRFLADWDGDEFFNAEARPGDPLNLVLTPLTWADFEKTTSSGGTDAQIALTTDYGTQYTQWSSGTNSNAYVQHGGALDSITGTIANSTAHTLIFWMRTNNAAYDAINFTVEIYNASNTLLATSSSFNVTHTVGVWRQIVVNFTTAASGSGAYFRLIRAGTTSLTNINLTGFMVVVGTYSSGDAIGFNVGDESNLYDHLNAWIRNARWNIGARQAYADLCDMGELTAELENDERIFSPEYSSSPLSGNMVERIIVVRAKAPGDTSFTTLWSGWIDSILPLTNVPGGNKTATLSATNALRFLEGKEIRIPLQVNVLETNVIDAILNTAQVPGGSSMSVGGATGSYTWPYVGDNWEDGIDAVQALAETSASERDFIHIQRDGDFSIWGRGTRYDLDTVFSSLAATMDNVHEAADYRYGDVIYNSIEVVRRPRRLSSSTTALVWTLNQNIVLAPSTSRTIFAKYNDSGANNNGVKAVGVVPGSIASGTFTSSGGTVNHSETAFAQGCEITYTNPSPSVSRTVTAHTLTGQRIIAKDEVIERYQDSASITAYGERSLRLDLQNVSDVDDQDEIGAIELARHKDPFGRFASITILAGRNTTQESWAVDLTINSKIRVIDDQTDHDAYYIVVGEGHELGDGFTTHRVTYTLEPAVSGLI